MSVELLYQELNQLNDLRENRKRIADLVLNNKSLIKSLISITFMVDDKVSVKASWILEWICTHNSINNILPYLDDFTNGLFKLKFDSAIRPCAKICEHLANSFTNKTNNKVKEILQENHIEAIISIGFDWLITPQKIAVRAYTMNTLFLLGLQKDWVIPELKHLIETKIIHESKGTKARGKQILNLIEKHQKRQA